MSSLFSACSDQMNLAHIVMQTATCQTPNRLQCTTHKPQCLVVHDQLSKGENKNVTQLDQESNFHFQTVLLFSFLHQTSLKSNVQIRWGFFFFSFLFFLLHLLQSYKWFYHVFALVLPFYWWPNKQVLWSVNRDSTIYFIINTQRTWFPIINIELFDSMDQVRIQQIHVTLVISIMTHQVSGYNYLYTRQTTLNKNT